MMEIAAPFLVIAVFAIVQSLFGVGLLVFGTPTLLLLGYSFDTALATLLPASIAVSGLQIANGKKPSAVFVRQFALWCIVPLAAVLAMVLGFKIHVSVNFVVAAVLALFAGLRLSPALASKASVAIARYPRIGLVLMGTVHGLSNLGGAILTVFATARESDKQARRDLVAFCYVCFAAVQLAVLAFLRPENFGVRQLLYAALAGAIYLVAGQRVFVRLPVPAYERLLTMFIASYSALLGLKAFGVI